ncbi:MBL fold metallo-hydrolase, partial [Singulisphaera rosea]
MEPEDYQIVPVESAPFAEVAYVIWRPGREDALVIDPSFDTATILGILEAEKKTLAAILNTHGHVDHIAGNARMKEAYPDVPLIIGKNEVALLSDPEANLSAKFGMPVTSPPADRLLSDGERLELAGFSMEIREIPG